MKKRTLPSWLLLIFGLLLLPMGCVDLGPESGVDTVDVSPTTATLTAIGATVQFNAVARDSEGNRIIDAGLSWVSSNEGVATVDKNGLATAVADGTTSISAGPSFLFGFNVTHSGSASLTVVVQ